MESDRAAVAPDLARPLRPRAVRVVVGTALLFAACTAVTALVGHLVGVFETADGSTALDQSVLDWLVAHRTDALTELFRHVTSLGSSLVITPLAIVVGLVLFATKRRWLASYFITVVIGASLLTALTKVLVGRTRPPVDTRLVSVGEYSFPSGHSTQAAASYVALAIIVGTLVASPRVRAALWTVVTVVVVAVGVSRLYLGVHWLTDVLAGWALGTAWAFGTAVVFAPLGAAHTSDVATADVGARPV